MNAYETAQLLGLTGTDAQIVSQLQPITAQPISLAYLMELLNFRGMLRKTDGSGGQERWVGTLQNLKAALVAMAQAESVTAYETWFSHVTNPRQINWDTSRPEYAIAFAAMQASFAGVENMPSVEDFESVVALGGGRPYVAITVEEFAGQRTEAETQAAAEQAAATRTSADNRLVSILNETLASVTSQLQSSQAALSDAELKALLGPAFDAGGVVIGGGA